MLFKFKLLHCLVLLFVVSKVDAQKEANMWYFGYKAGIDFNGKAPVVLIDGAMSTIEGCAVISDSAGNLLFYTNGVKVWNRNHMEMANGFGLNGHESATQSAVIVPRPGNKDLYYVFTVDALGGSNGLQYSNVDISRDGGLGEVTIKNKKIITPTTEKLTAIRHFNRKDVWIIGHEWNSTRYFSILVNEKGIQDKNIVYSNGIVIHELGNSAGYLKVSSAGNKVASVVWDEAGSAEILDFDNKTGKLSNLILIDNLYIPYGVEFSNDNKKLYVTTRDKKRAIYQFDISSHIKEKILKTKATVFLSDIALGALQLAPDGKIYVARLGEPHLGVIEFPNESGIDCKYKDLGVYLKGKKSAAGLPAFIQSYFTPPIDFSYTHACEGEPMNFKGLTNIDADIYYWNFGDLAAGNMTSNLKDPSYTYKKTGTYKVKFIVGKDSIYDTVIKYIRVEAIPNPNLGKDQLRCNGETVELDAGTGEKYRWNTGDSTRTIKVTKSGKYWVRVNNQTCANSDSVNVQFLSKEDLQLGDDTVLCHGSKCIVRSKINGAKYLWNTGSRDSAISVFTSGNYWLNTTVGDWSVTDTIKVTFIPPPSINMGNDSMLCEGDELVLDAKNPGAEYEWSTGENTQKITVKIGGNYWVKVYAGDCSASDTIHFYPCPARIIMPNAFTPNGDGLNDFYRVFAADVFKGTLTITNRWGEIIFQTDDIYKGWDGKYHGKKSPDGQYFWTLLYWDYDGKVLYPREKKGPFYLLGQ